MQIIIDTKKDSAEDIRKVISLLQSMVSQPSTGNPDIFGSSQQSNPASSAPTSFFNMFGDASPSKAADASDKEEDDEEQEEQQDIPQVIPY